MEKGKIIRIMEGKGFGFIKIEGKENDLFFHANSLLDIDFRDLKEGDEVEFEVEEGQKGPNAVNVKRV